MKNIWMIFLAYAGGFFVVAPLAVLVGSPLALLSTLKKSDFWFGLASFVGAVIAYFFLRWYFVWLDVHFGWYAYLICMVSVMLYEGNRASAGGTPAYATGALLGMIYSLLQHFFG